MPDTVDSLCLWCGKYSPLCSTNYFCSVRCNDAFHAAGHSLPKPPPPPPPLPPTSGLSGGEIYFLICAVVFFLWFFGVAGGASILAITFAGLIR